MQLQLTPEYVMPGKLTTSKGEEGYGAKGTEL